MYPSQVRQVPEQFTGIVQSWDTASKACLHDVARKMFQAYEAFYSKPVEAESLPAIKSLTDHAACVARLRRIMEDPQKLLSNCVADYIIDELQRCNYHPKDIQISRFTNVDY